MTPKEGREGQEGRTEGVSEYMGQGDRRDISSLQRTGKQKRVGVDTKWIGSCELNGQKTD